MERIPINELIISDRFRKDYGNIQELASSIREVGLIQPVVVAGRRLVAGGRRVAACKELGWKDIPTVQLGDLPLDVQLEIELEENVRRKDMTWQERTLAIARIHRLKQQQAAMQGKSWGVRQTGMELGLSLGNVSYLLRIADELNSNPNSEMWKADGLLSAIRILVAREELAARQEWERRQSAKPHPLLASRAAVQETKSPPPVDIPLSTMILPTETRIEEDFPADYLQLAMFHWRPNLPIAAIVRLLRPGGSLVCWDADASVREAVGAHMLLMPNQLIWHDTNPQESEWPFYQDQRTAIVGVKGALASPAPRSSVISVPSQTEQVPFAAYEHAISALSLQGQSVFDPTGNQFILECVIKTGRRPIVIAHSAEQFDMLVEMAKELYRQVLVNVTFS